MATVGGEVTSFAEQAHREPAFHLVQFHVCFVPLYPPYTVTISVKQGTTIGSACPSQITPKTLHCTTRAERPDGTLTRW